MLFDEPFSNIDPSLRGELRELLRRVHRENDATIVFVTHDLQEAFALADRIAVMKDGRLEELGTPRALRRAPQSELLRRFLQG